jgi:hypothetical protein
MAHGPANGGESSPDQDLAVPLQSKVADGVIRVRVEAAVHVTIRGLTDHPAQKKKGCQQCCLKKCGVTFHGDLGFGWLFQFLWKIRL